MLRIAFATDNRSTVNQHFGATRGFAIYALDEHHAQLVELVEFPADGMDGNEDKLASRIQALSGCAAVYCLAIGASAVNQLVTAGVQPVRIDGAAPIEPLLKSIRHALRMGGMPRIDKSGKQGKDDARFARMAEENWEE